MSNKDKSDYDLQREHSDTVYDYARENALEDELKNRGYEHKNGSWDKPSDDYEEENEYYEATGTNWVFIALVVIAFGIAIAGEIW